MGRIERRAAELAERKREKRTRKEARATPPLAFLARKRSEYAVAWDAQARTLAADGHYEWMAGLLPAAGGRLLEVGVGTGRSTLSLARRGWRVVGIDENDACLRAAAAFLSESGLTCELGLRGRARETTPGVHAIDYVAALPARDAQVVLVEGDVLDDPDLPRLLVGAGPFDAVVCWLVDTHDARAAHRKVIEIGMRSPDEYRLGVQKLAYGLADKVLRPGGVLHVVDRAQERVSEALAAGYLRVRDAQARGTSLELASLDVRGAFVSVRSRGNLHL